MNELGTPPELEALATRKFSCFYRYKDLHEKLFDANESIECTAIASELMDCYIENRQIYQEFEYYKASGKILGKHPIFLSFVRSAEINKMTIKELMIEQRKLNNNIWRVKNEMAKGDKPHLDTERKTRLKQMMIDIAQINKLLNE